MNLPFAFSSARVFGLFGLATIALTGACSSSSDNDASDFVNQFCDFFGPCCAKAGLPTNGQQCRLLYSFGVSGAAYDSAKGDACLSELRAAQSKDDVCDSTTNYAPSCDGAFSAGGTKKPGDLCDTDGECAPSPKGKVSCESSYTGSVKTSVCQVRIEGKEGDTPCGGTVDGNLTVYTGSPSGSTPPAETYLCNVKDDLYCKSSFGSTTVVPTCTRIQKTGGSCDGSTSTQYACVKTAYCDFGTKLCTDKVGIGVACSSTDNCVTGAYCDTTAGSSAKCLAQVAEGAACSSGDQCLSGTCNNKLCTKGTTSNIALAFICGSN